MKLARNSCETPPLENAQAPGPRPIFYTGKGQLSERFYAFSTTSAAPIANWRGWIGVCLLALSGNVFAASPTPLANKSLATPPTQMTERSDYRNSSDAQLTQLVRNWGQLSPTERRLLLSEIRSRMKQADAQGVTDGEANASQPQANLNRVLAQRTYGRTTQRPDGSVVTETETIKITTQGRQVTRQTTISPPAKSTPNLAATGKVVAEPNSANPPRRVMRTKIRFGAGFERRQGAAAESQTQQYLPERAAAKSPSQADAAKPKAKPDSTPR